MRSPKRPHYAGTQHQTPECDSKGWQRVMLRGCGGYQDYWGEYDCSHGYTWACEECPIVIAKHDAEPDEGEQQAVFVLEGPPHLF